MFVHHINIIDKDILAAYRFSEDPMPVLYEDDPQSKSEKTYSKSTQ